MNATCLLGRGPFLPLRGMLSAQNLGMDASDLTFCELLGDVCMAAIHHCLCVSPSSLIPKGQRKRLLCQSWSLTNGGSELIT